MMKIFKVILAVVLLWCAICAIKPFWNKYWLSQDLKAVAIYGTKHSLADTRKRLSTIMEQENYGFSANDFYIEKNANKDTTIGITYEDEIRIFGVTLMELELSVEETRSEVKASY
jgi:hypothetical protein